MAHRISHPFCARGRPRPGRAGRQRLRFRPRLEQLEDRATPTTVTGTPGDDLLVVYLTPGGGPADMSYVLNSDAPVNLSGEKSFTFNGGDGNDTVILSGTAQSCSVTLNGQDGDDSFYVGTCDGWNTTLGGPLTVNGGAGANLLSVLDGARISGSDTVSVNANELKVTNVYVDSFSIVHDGAFSRGLLLTAGPGQDFVHVNSAQSGCDTRVYTQGGDDLFWVTYGSIAGPLLVDGGAGANRVSFQAGAIASPVVLTRDTCTMDNVPVVYTATGGSFAGGVLVLNGTDQVTVLSARPDSTTRIDGIDSVAFTVYAGAGSAYNLIVAAWGYSYVPHSLTVVDTGRAVVRQASNPYLAATGVVQLFYGDGDVSSIAYANIFSGLTVQ